MMGRPVPTIIGLIFVSVLGVYLVKDGCSAKLSDNLIVNPFHSSTAKISVLTTYFSSGPDGNLYRVYAVVREDSDRKTPCETGEEHSFKVCPRETFEIGDSFLDGNYRSADLFGELRANEQSDKLFAVELRGERSGVSGTGTFRQIHAVSEGE